MIISVLPLMLPVDVQPSMPEGPLPAFIKVPGDEGLKIQPVISAATQPAISNIIVVASLGSKPDMNTSSATVAEYTLLAEKTLRSSFIPSLQKSALHKPFQFLPQVSILKRLLMFMSFRHIIYSRPTKSCC
jgi:hypothetical protein